MLIGVTGYAQHGKDTTGSFLEEHYGGQKVAFADQLRSLAMYVDPWVRPYDPRFQSPKDVSALRYSELLDAVGYENAKRFPEVRQFLVDLGIGVRMYLGEDAWVKALELRIMPAVVAGANVVVTDVRFPNEAEFIREYGKLLRVERPGVEAVPHGSDAEKYIPDLPVDQHVVAHSEDQLRRLVDSVMRAWGVPDSTPASTAVDAGSSPAPSTEEA